MPREGGGSEIQRRPPPKAPQKGSMASPPGTALFCLAGLALYLLYSTIYAPLVVLCLLAWGYVTYGLTAPDEYVNDLEPPAFSVLPELKAQIQKGIDFANK